MILIVSMLMILLVLALTLVFVIVFSLVHEACYQKGEPCKLLWDVQHVVVLRHEDFVAVCNHVCCIVLGHGTCKHLGADAAGVNFD